MSFTKIWSVTLLLVFTAIIIMCCLPVITPFFLGAIFAYVLYTPTMFLEKKLKIKSWLAALIIIVLCFFVIVFAIYLFLPPLIKQGQTFLESIPNVTNSFTQVVKNVKAEMIARKVPTAVISGVDTALNKIYSIFSDFIISVINFLFSLITKIVDIFLVVVITVYMLIDGKRLIDGFMAKIPLKFRPRAEKIAQDINEIMKNYIKAQIYIAAITAVGTFIILTALGVQYAGLISLLAFLLNFIPYFGASLVTIFAGALSYFSGGIVRALIVWLLLIIFGQIKGNIINPKIQSKASGMHPLTVLLAIIVCNHLLGVFGMFVAIVVAGIIKLIYKNAIDIIEELE